MIHNVKKLILTVITRCNTVLSFKASQGDVKNDVQQQEGKTGEAQRL